MQRYRCRTAQAIGRVTVVLGKFTFTIYVDDVALRVLDPSSQLNKFS